MITVTDSAKQELKAILAARSDGSADALRLGFSASGQFGLGLDQEKEGDQIVAHEGGNVLFVGSELTEALNGATIDCEETTDERRLTISKA
ncbi:MAG: hypothetical protein AAB037_03330 [Chloroflexota bacterium]